MEIATIETQKNVSLDSGATFLHPCDYCYQYYLPILYLSIVLHILYCNQFTVLLRLYCTLCAVEYSLYFTGISLMY